MEEGCRIWKKVVNILLQGNFHKPQPTGSKATDPRGTGSSSERSSGQESCVGELC